MFYIAFTFEAIYVVLVGLAIVLNKDHKELLALSCMVLAIHFTDLLVSKFIWESAHAVQLWYLRVIVMNYALIAGCSYILSRYPQTAIRSTIKLTMYVCAISILVNLAQFYLRNFQGTTVLNDVYSFVERFMMLIILASLFQNKINDLLGKLTNMKEAAMRKLYALVLAFVSVYLIFEMNPKYAFAILSIGIALESFRMVIRSNESVYSYSTAPIDGTNNSEIAHSMATCENNPKRIDEYIDIARTTADLLDSNESVKTRQFLELSVKSQRLKEKYPEDFADS